MPAARPALLQLCSAVPGCLGWYPALVNSSRNARRPVGKKPMVRPSYQPEPECLESAESLPAPCANGQLGCRGGCHDALPEKLQTSLSRAQSRGPTGDSDVFWVKDTSAVPGPAQETSPALAAELCCVPPLPLARFGDSTAGTDPAAWHLRTVTPEGQSPAVKAAELPFKYLPRCDPGCVTVALHWWQPCSSVRQKNRNLNRLTMAVQWGWHWGFCSMSTGWELR